MKTYMELVRHGGNQRLFQAVEMSVLATQVNRSLHIHAEGPRGTGKTTLFRAARDLLPLIQRIRGCRYNCHPLQPHCPEHFHLSPGEVAAIGTEQVPMPFWEISSGSEMGTVAGIIEMHNVPADIHPAASILPGIIPRANRGILFIDDINRLADASPDLIKAIVDVMAAKPGRVQIEQSGLPTVQIPVQVSVWATSDPDDFPGPLERVCQGLVDCFDMVIRLGRPSEMEFVQQVLQQSLGYRTNPRQVIFTDPLTDLRQQKRQLRAVAGVFEQIRMSDAIKNMIANIYLDFGLQSLRVLEAMELGSRLHAALQNRQQVQMADLTAVIPLILAHRVSLQTLEKVLAYLDYAHFVESTPTLPEKLDKTEGQRST